MSTSIIAKNAAALLVAQLITWALSIILAFFISRYLGPGGFGTLQFAGSIWAIGGVLIGWGMDVFLTKAIARSPDAIAGLLRKTFIWRTILFVITLCCVVVYGMLQGFTGEMMEIIIITGVSTLLNQYATGYIAALQGLELMQYSSLATVLTKIGLVALSLLALSLHVGLYGFAWAGLGANLIFLVTSRWFLQRHKAQLQPSRSERFSAQMLRDSTPYLASSLIVVVYLQIGTLILGSTVNTVAVGWYSAAITLYGTLLFVPTILTTAIFPAMARSYTSTTDARTILLRKSFDVMLLMGVPLGLGLAVTSQQLVVLLFGEAFVQSGPVLAIMGVVLIFMYQNILTGQFLISIDRQNIWTIVLAVSTVLTIGIELLLIPWFHTRFGNGALGAATGFLVAEAGMAIIGLILMPRGTLSRANASSAARILLAGLVMTVACWPFREAFVGITILVGALVFISAVLMLRVLPAEDIQFVAGYTQRFFARLHRHVKMALGGRGSW